jgi:hypothetical protein
MERNFLLFSVDQSIPVTAKRATSELASSSQGKNNQQRFMHIPYRNGRRVNTPTHPPKYSDVIGNPLNIRL